MDKIIKVMGEKMKKHIYALLFVSLAATLYAQEALKSTEEEYYDFLYLLGKVECPTLNYRTLSDNEWNLTEGTQHLWQNNNLGKTFNLYSQNIENKNWFLNGLDLGLKAKIYGPQWFNSYNTASPYGQNDGALWQGVGYNTSLTGGLRLEGYGFELTFKPQLSFSQNAYFEIMPSAYSSEYGYYGVKSIDFPQRFGDSAFFTYDWGESEVRWSWYTFTLGLGTQNPWLGPAWLNPMLGSNNAAGFPKFDIGIRKTELYVPYYNWYLGAIEARTWCGALQESDYFDSDLSNDWRMLFGLNFSYAPSFIPNFTVGFNRILYTEWDIAKLSWWTRLVGLETINQGWQDGTDNHEDQKVSLYCSWSIPSVGFEVYGEYGFDDFTSRRIENPFHTGIYTVGAKQIIPLSHKKLSSELIFEWNNFEMSQDFQLQWKYIGYYGHGQVAQGYTNRGQILGAGSGQFGNSQYLQYKVYFPRGSASVYFHRYCPNNNYIYNMAVENVASYVNEDYYANYNTFMVLGFTSQYFLFKNFSLSAKFAYVHESSVNYQKDNSNNINSFQIGFTAEYKF